MKNALILGSGGREHVLAWKLNQSPSINHIYVAPGNAGTAYVATNVDLGILDFEAIGAFCVENEISILIPGSEDPLVAGIADYFNDHSHLKDVFVFGPNKQAAELEGSKEFAKKFLIENNIPTAQYESFTSDTIKEAKAYLRTKAAPYVLKADGLAAGKGVVISETLEDADRTLDEMLLDQKFGAASSKVVIEDFLQGVEFSFFAMTDGENYLILPEAKDYKRIGEGDTGLNTGGMGAVSPVPFVDAQYLEKVEKEIIKPTFDGFKKRKMNYVGFVFFGLINDNGNPKVIEYNVRMGDPETEVVFPRIENDFAELLNLASNKRLCDAKIQLSNKVCTTVFTVSGGYPEDYQKGKKINFLKNLDTDILIFQAGTKLSDNDISTSGGRVIAVSALADSLKDALSKSYDGVGTISFEDMYFRKDIGQDLLNY